MTDSLSHLSTVAGIGESPASHLRMVRSSRTSTSRANALAESPDRPIASRKSATSGVSRLHPFGIITASLDPRFDVHTDVTEGCEGVIGDRAGVVAARHEGAGGILHQRAIAPLAGGFRCLSDVAWIELSAIVPGADLEVQAEGVFDGVPSKAPPVSAVLDAASHSDSPTKVGLNCPDSSKLGHMPYQVKGYLGAL